jgi:hypothetical protein
MPFGIDILEDEIKSWGHKILETLLCDRTTGKNIFWATHDYESRGADYNYHSEIQPPLITGKNKMLLRPRVLKTKEQQTSRTKIKAEIFTPSWVCNIQNNVTDESWFGRKGVFNTEDIDKMTWKVNTAPIVFSGGKTWKDYVSAKRIEITCGEAPYLASRYDTTSGKLIALENRIGLLDRKLRVVGENTSTPDEWLESAEIAYKSIYGFEWQGDSLLLARESLLVTFIEYFTAKFHKKPEASSIEKIAYVISWNLWQMDGLKYVVPDSCHDTKVSNGDMFNPIEIVTACEGCQTNNIRKHNGVYCLIKNWDEMDKDTGEMGSIVRFVDLLKR